jgi:histidyl-tRNA synthetase
MKPSLPQGTRDFSPGVVRRRQYIFQTIRGIFEKYGFQPLETPAMENLETLMGKYGDEGDRLIFKILNNGLDHEKKRDLARLEFEKVLEGKNVKVITERALRYDLTIPFARYVAMNHGQLVFPFKRFQIQPVWRADSPQKGRYREFYQCDADVVGSKSLFNEVELTCIYMEAFKALGIPVELRINSRKMLGALAIACGGTDQLTNITVAIDKLDKIGLEKVKNELVQRGLMENQIAIIEKYLLIKGNTAEKLQQIEELLGKEELCRQALSEFKYILDYSDSLPDPTALQIDFTLARGLNYYTGIIFEVKAVGVQMGSIGGGGRYDDLTGLFGVPDIPGVGISFGVDRIYDVMEELKLFPEALLTGTQLLFFNLGEQESKTAFKILQELRSNGIAAEIFHETAKFDKQFKYAEKKNIPYIVIIGTREMEEGNVVVKELSTGIQTSIPANQLLDFIRSK